MIRAINVIKPIKMIKKHFKWHINQATPSRPPHALRCTRLCVPWVAFGCRRHCLRCFLCLCFPSHAPASAFHGWRSVVAGIACDAPHSL